MSSNANCKTIYRIKVTHKNMLEWVTAEEAEKMAKRDVISYYINMATNVVSGILGILYLSIIEQFVRHFFIFALYIVVISTSYYVLY